MPRYIIERDVGSLTQEELEATGRKSNEVLEAMSGVVWIRSYISAAEGKIYCEYDAPNPKAIQEHARRTECRPTRSQRYHWRSIRRCSASGIRP